MAAEIREVTIVSVDPENKLATVRLDYGTAKDPVIIPDVRLNAFKGGKASGAMPEEGEPWLALRTSESAEQWFLLQPRDHEGTMNTDLDPGDHGWVLPLGSRIVLRKNGRIELYSKATASIYLVPSQDLVQILTSNYELVTPQGKMSWKDAVLDFVVGHDLGESTLHMRFGSTGKDFGVKDWAGEGGAVYSSVVCGAFHAEIAADGSYSEEAQTRGVSVKGDSYTDVEGHTFGTFKDSMTLETEAVDINTLKTVYWYAKLSVTFEAPEIRFDTQRLILTEEDGFVIDGVKFMQWLTTDFLVTPAGTINPSCLLTFPGVLNFKVQV